MISQAGSNQLPLKQNKKVFNRHPESFLKYHIMASDIASKTAATQINTISVPDRGKVEETTSQSNDLTCDLS